ncbi:MAG: hypothetical protein IPM97_01925 [Bdellovibrionaceae bacterium]|nr:hypothetical protein [Pseudobdellovibrionaceae bacterium]
MKKYIKLMLLIIPLGGVVVMGFNNCARYGELENASTGSSSLASTSGGPSGGDSIDSQSLGIPFALLSAEQTLASMMKVTNLTTASAATLTEYTARYGSLAAGNDLNMANGPLMLGSTSLAGEVCNSLVAQESAAAAAARNFFGSINFAAGIASVDNASYALAIRGMARSFWGRNENASELAMLTAFKQEMSDALAAANRTAAASTRSLVVGTCAAMLSSLDALTY